jgi:hypothetical protein
MQDVSGGVAPLNSDFWLPTLQWMLNGSIKKKRDRDPSLSPLHPSVLCISALCILPGTDKLASPLGAWGLCFIWGGYLGPCWILLHCTLMNQAGCLTLKPAPPPTRLCTHCTYLQVSSKTSPVTPPLFATYVLFELSFRILIHATRRSF